MYLALLAVIYLSFISLGLPDTVLGSAWPLMHTELGVGIAHGGLVSMTISLMTVVSSLLSDRINQKLHAGIVTFVSTLMTAVALWGFSLCTRFWMLLLWAIPYGLGAGSVDAALNNYVAIHYKSSHMSWLHCMWGIGASVGPWIMGRCLVSGMGWPAGYQIIGSMQAVLTLILLCSLPLWRQKEHSVSEDETRNVLSLKEAIALPGAKQILVAFLCYCGLEGTTGLWAASWLVTVKGFSATEAAGFAALFYLGITIGRALSGFISDSTGDVNMIRLGQGITLLGILLLILGPSPVLYKTGLTLIGLGCAPIYPSIIHSTPDRFGKENSQSLVGIQMAAAYVGSMFVPKGFGLLSDWAGMHWYSAYLLFFLVLMTVMTEHANRQTSL